MRAVTSLTFTTPSSFTSHTLSLKSAAERILLMRAVTSLTFN